MHKNNMYNSEIGKEFLEDNDQDKCGSRNFSSQPTYSTDDFV